MPIIRSVGVWKLKKIKWSCRHIGKSCNAKPPITMSCLCWNAQGMRNPETISTLGKTIHKVSPSLVFFKKTRLDGAWARSVHYKVGFENCFVVDYVRRSGALMLLWQDKWDVSILSSSRGHTDAWVVSVNRLEGRFTGFYGNPTVSNRQFSWDLWGRLNGMKYGPWVMGGNFNEMLSLSEKLVGNYQYD